MVRRCLQMLADLAERRVSWFWVFRFGAVIVPLVLMRGELEVPRKRGDERGRDFGWF